MQYAAATLAVPQQPSSRWRRRQVDARQPLIVDGLKKGWFGGDHAPFSNNSAIVEMCHHHQSSNNSPPFPRDTPTPHCRPSSWLVALLSTLSFTALFFVLSFSFFILHSSIPLLLLPPQSLEAYSAALHPSHSLQSPSFYHLLRFSDGRTNSNNRTLSTLHASMIFLVVSAFSLFAAVACAQPQSVPARATRAITVVGDDVYLYGGKI